MGSNEQFGCVSSEFEQYASDPNVLCDTSPLTNINTSSWYGFTGNSYGNFIGMSFATNIDPICYCSYTFEICETRRELSCIGTDVPYNSSDADALCAVDDSDWSRFVGGGETDIVSYGGASINSTAETCSCSYEVDNCLDDVDYHDNFLKPINESLAFCNISLLLPCCGDSELAFGGTKISELNLTSYLSLAEDDGNEWECYNGDDFCPSSMDNVPTTSEYWFSWLYNEEDGANGFDGDSLCQCWVHSENCTTDAPTSPPTNNPTFVPTAMPTAEPSPSPTKYQFDDYDTASVVQLCCNNASITDFSDETCPDDSAPEDSFDGTSDSIEYDTYILNNGEYYCYFDVGHWNWSIPSAAGYAAIDDAIWPEMMSNVSWNWTMTDLEESDFTSSSSSRRRLVDLSCFDVLVTECDDSNACLGDNEPIASNWSFNNILIGDTFENFTAWTLEGTSEDIDYCFCYWMYDKCTTLSPTAEPTDITVAPSNAPTPFGEDAVAAVTENWISDNMTYVIIIVVGIFLFFAVCCMLCIWKRKQFYAEEKRKMEETVKSSETETGGEPLTGVSEEQQVIELERNCTEYEY